MKPDKLKLAYKLTFCYLLYHILLVTAILFFVDRGIVLLENRFEEKYRENAEVSMDARQVRFDLKPGKVFLFDRKTEERIEFDASAISRL